MNDPERKTLRHFYCQESLWRSFERMSEELDRGLDDLVNEAMRALAQKSGYLPEASPTAETPPPVARVPMPMRAPTPPPLPPPRAPSMPPPPPFAAPPAPGRGAEAAVPPLFLIFDNRKYRIDKEQFIIGRGVKSSDLPIRDGNISRKHAAVVRKNGAYYIKDLGSTNGIDFNGMRIDNRVVEEGDVYYLCDYQLRFTFH